MPGPDLRLLRRGPLPGAVLLVALALGACTAGDPSAKKVVVLGFDGMDYLLTGQMMSAGELPNFERLADQGIFQPLGTSIPPQSPVAWSNFITGMDAGGHGIFDFLHRDPTTMVPFLSTSQAVGAERTLKIGGYQFPLSGGKVELLRRGTPFWEVLERQGIPTTVLRMPANFPPSETASRELSGMGTPDILGTSGTFSYYTSELFAFEGQEIDGGDVYEVFEENGKVEGALYGPDNPFLVEPQKTQLDWVAYVDPVDPVIKLAIGDGEAELVLKQGEWSDWIPVEFPLIPAQKLRAEARFYLKQVRPEFILYATPLNFDPLDPALPISHPDDYAAELAEETGRYFTQGMPEDTKALTEGVFTRDEFLSQAHMAGQEVVDQYPRILGDFHGGLLFYYFGDGDQVSHLMWRPMDPDHPAYDPETDPKYADVVKSIYRGFDEVVGYTLDHLGPDDKLFVMSDHGFTSWRRVFSLNSWLRDHGYLAVKDPNLAHDPGFFSNIDWTRTRAYGLGFNSLYVNLRGREKYGTVDPSQKKALLEEIGEELRATRDPETGQPAVTEVLPAEEAYHDRGQLQIGPDMIVGYAKGTRASNVSTIGGVPLETFADNTGVWSGDHLMDHRSVPGILLASGPLKRPAASLQDLAGAILAEFGIRDFPPSK